MRALTQKYPAIVFFVLTYALAWLVWIPLWFGKIPEKPGINLILLGAFAPSVSGILLIALTSGTSGVKKLLSRALKWRLSLTRYLVALFWIAIIILASIGIHILLGGKAPEFSLLKQYGLLLLVLFIQVTLMNGPLQEEFGWRGFALDALQQRYSALLASVVIGILWGCWHLPLFAVPYASQAGIPLVMYLLYHIPLTVVMVWLVNRSGGSLLMALLFHASINVWGILLPLLPKAAGTDRIFNIAVLLMWLTAIALVFFERQMFMQKQTN